MNTKFSAENYKNFSRQLYDLIKSEFESVSDLESQYPKFIIMYEFFRMIRGEAFTELREPTPEFQKELYEMEKELKKITTKLKSELNPKSSKLQTHLDEIKNLLTVK